MKTIFKYAFDLDSETILAPEGAKVLTVAMQDNVFQVWAEVDTDKPLVHVHMAMFGTGQDMQDMSSGAPLRFVNTTFVGNGRVFHFYQEMV